MDEPFRLLAYRVLVLHLRQEFLQVEHGSTVLLELVLDLLRDLELAIYDQEQPFDWFALFHYDVSVFVISFIKVISEF